MMSKQEYLKCWLQFPFFVIALKKIIWSIFDILLYEEEIEGADVLEI